MIFIINEKGLMKNIEENFVEHKDYNVYDATSGGSSELFSVRGIKVIRGLELPDILDEEDAKVESKDRSFEKYINSKAFYEAVLTVISNQVDVEHGDENFFIVLSNSSFEQYGEAFYDMFIEAAGVENREDAPYVILYEPFKKKDKESKEYKHFHDYFMKWVEKDIKEETLKALKKGLKRAFKALKYGEDDDSSSKSYKDRKEGKKYSIDLDSVSVKKKDKDKKKKKHDDDVEISILESDKKKKKKDKKKDKKKKKDKYGYDESGLDDIKGLMKDWKKKYKNITLR